MSHDFRNNKDASRFEATIDGHTAFVDYRLSDGAIALTHTEVPSELSGRGLANDIVSHALDHARANDLRVEPQCRFVRKYIERHPEYSDLVG